MLMHTHITTRNTFRGYRLRGPGLQNPVPTTGYIANAEFKTQQNWKGSMTEPGCFHLETMPNKLNMLFIRWQKHSFVADSYK